MISRLLERPLTNTLARKLTSLPVFPVLCSEPSIPSSFATLCRQPTSELLLKGLSTAWMIVLLRQARLQTPRTLGRAVMLSPSILPLSTLTMPTPCLPRTADGGRQRPRLLWATCSTMETCSQIAGQMFSVDNDSARIICSAPTTHRRCRRNMSAATMFEVYLAMHSCIRFNATAPGSRYLSWERFIRYPVSAGSRPSSHVLFCSVFGFSSRPAAFVPWFLIPCATFVSRGPSLGRRRRKTVELAFVFLSSRTSENTRNITDCLAYHRKSGTNWDHAFPPQTAAEQSSLACDQRSTRHPGECWRG
eukprot:m.551392 g.551392  ORF g.551392 m.551392 type:complete len:305 (+) comp57734_c0_seq6:2780-3694(+)